MAAHCSSSPLLGGMCSASASRNVFYLCKWGDEQQMLSRECLQAARAPVWAHGNQSKLCRKSVLAVCNSTAANSQHPESRKPCAAHGSVSENHRRARVVLEEAKPVSDRNGINGSSTHEPDGMTLLGTFEIQTETRSLKLKSGRNVHNAEGNSKSKVDLASSTSTVIPEPSLQTRENRPGYAPSNHRRGDPAMKVGMPSTSSKQRLGKANSRHPWSKGMSNAGARLYAAIAERPHELSALLGAQGRDLRDEDLVGVLKGFGNDGSWQLALRVFDWMRTNRTPGCRAIAVILRILGHDQRLKEAQDLFESLQGEGRLLDVYCYTSMISCYARAGQFEDALTLFEGMKASGLEPNLVTFNVLIGIHGRRMQGGASRTEIEREGQSKGVEAYGPVVIGCSISAEEAWAAIMALFNELVGRGLQPDEYTYNTMISACSRGGLCEEAEGVVRAMRESGCQPDRVTYNALLDVYGKAGRLEQAMAVLEEMRKCEGCAPNMVTFNELIGACGRAGKLKEARGLIATMRMQGLQPDLYTYSIQLAALGRAGLVEEARQLYAEMVSSGCRPNLVTFNTLIDMYGKAGLLDDMSEVLASMRAAGCLPDTVTWNCLLRAFGRGRRHTDLLAVLAQMQQAGCSPSSATFSTLVDACGRCGSATDAARILDAMLAAGHGPCPQAYAALLAAQAREGLWKVAEATLAEMVSRGLQPEGPHQASLLHAYANANCPSRLLAALQRLKTPSGSMPYNSLLVQRAAVLALCKCGLEVEAEAALEDLRAAGHTPDVSLFNALLALYGRLGKLGKVRALLAELPELGLRPDLVTYNCLLGAYGREGLWEEALALPSAMRKEGVAPDVLSFNTLILTLCKHGRMEDAKKVLAEMEAAGLKPTLFTHNTFVNHYLGQGRFAEALQSIRRMRGMGCRPDEATYKAVLEACHRLGQSDEALLDLPDS